MKARRKFWQKPIRTQPHRRALEFAQAEVAAAAAKERRGDKGDSTMSGADLAAAVKFVHLEEVHERVELVQHRKKARSVLGGAFARLNRAGGL